MHYERGALPTSLLWIPSVSRQDILAAALATKVKSTNPALKQVQEELERVTGGSIALPGGGSLPAPPPPSKAAARFLQADVGGSSSAEASSSSAGAAPPPPPPPTRPMQQQQPRPRSEGTVRRWGKQSPDARAVEPEGHRSREESRDRDYFHEYPPPGAYGPAPSTAVQTAECTNYEAVSTAEWDAS